MNNQSAAVRFLYIIMLAYAMFSCSKTDAERIDEVPVDCIAIDLPENYSMENNYQMVHFGSIDKFRDSLNCFRLNDWINQKLYHFDNEKQFLDTLYTVNGIPSMKDSIFVDNMFLRLFRYNFGYGNGEITMVDCIYIDDTWHVRNYEVLFNRNCNTPSVSVVGNSDFNSSCFTLVRNTAKTIANDAMSAVHEAMFKTDFMNIAYFYTGELGICDGYDIQIIYDGKSNVSDSRREFYRSCPGELSPIGIVSKLILEL